MTEKEAERPVLIVQDNNNSLLQHWVMEKDAVVIGRGEESDLTLDERQISRQHIRIFKDSSKYFVEDLESKNGTWLNGNQFKGIRQLSDGDEIHLALVVRIQFVGSGATAPLPFEPPMSIGGRLRLDREARRVFIDDTELDPPLSLPQYRLLELLYNQAGRVCTREAVVETVWPEAIGEGVSEQAIDALVRRLRDRLAELDPDRQYIVTVRGHGFRMENPD
ncbi:MAG: FHA domain-containing protein [Anaerolineae bacterium]|nr:FHA domain-containing protein [Anaerolineae bacterium]